MHRVSRFEQGFGSILEHHLYVKMVAAIVCIGVCICRFEARVFQMANNVPGCLLTSSTDRSVEAWSLAIVLEEGEAAFHSLWTNLIREGSQQ